MAKTYSAKAIANFFLKLSENDSRPVTPLAIQKLVYFAHGWHLAFFNAPLISDNVEAWKFGPVIPSLYAAFQQYGKSQISRPATEFDFTKLESVPVEFLADNPNQEKLLNRVWKDYSRFTGLELSDITHRPDTPWSKVWGNGSTIGRVIDNALIKDYFVQEIEKLKKKTQA